MAQTLQINRWCELTIGDGKTMEAVVITNPIAISFSVDKSTTILKKQDTGKIQVFNLDDTTLKALQGDYPVAILKVGYGEDNLVTILKGEVISVSTKPEGTDKVTEILIGSAYTALNLNSVQVAVPESKSVKEVIVAIQNEMLGISKGVYSGFNIHEKVLYGYTTSGTPKQALDDICKTYHLDYKIDHDTLFVHDADGTINENYGEAPLINETSGLIGQPYQTKVAVGKAKKSIDNKGGVHFTVLLNPILQPGSIVRLESDTITGWFKISDLTHTGGNRKNEWYTECRCEDKNKINQTELDNIESGEN